MPNDTTPKPPTPAAAMSAADQALIDDLDRVLREAFKPTGSAPSPAQTEPPPAAKPMAARPVLRPVMPSVTPGAPVMMPMTRPVIPEPPAIETAREAEPIGTSHPVAESHVGAPAAAPAAIRASTPASALPGELRPVTTDEIAAATPKPSGARTLRPLPSMDDPVAPPPPIEPLSMGRARSRRWRPALAVTTVLLLMAAAAQFLVRTGGQTPVQTSNAPPLITAPVTPSTIPAPQQAEATEPEPAKPQEVPTAAPTPAQTAQTPAEPAPSAPVNAQPAAVPPPTAAPAPAPVIESAGVLGTPEPSPFDTVVPTRNVRTTVIAANDAAAAPAPPAKPLVIDDPATWPPGAAVAEPHPLPPRRK